MKRHYLDAAASTPTHPAVIEAMLPWLREAGNPSSIHAEGRRAKDALDVAREQIAARAGCLFGEITFTSCGTEACNQAILGVARTHQSGSRKRIILGAAEHHCVLHTAPQLAAMGYTVDLAPVDRLGRTSPEYLELLLGPDVLLVSFMHANNETGVIQDVRRAADLVHAHGAMLHADCVQTFCTLPWTRDSLDADLISISAHKIHGPKGAGALITRAGVMVDPIIVGGGQEREMRGGTESVASIVGFGVASQIAEPYTKARDAFRTELDRLASDAVIFTTGTGDDVLPGHCHVRFPGRTASTMLIELDREGIAASSGAACSSGSIEPSHVLLAAGYSESEAHEAIRFTFCRDMPDSEAIEAAKIVAKMVAR